MNEIPSYLNNPNQAFLDAQWKHPLKGGIQQEPQSEWLGISTDYFLSGLNFLEKICNNRSLIEQARIASIAIQKCSIYLSYIDIGPIVEPNNIKFITDKPKILNVGFSQDARNGLDFTLFMTRNFVNLAQYNPLDALAHVAYINSCIRDFACHRRWIDWEKFSPRAQAAAAEVILHYANESDYWRLSTDIIDMIQEFPDGLQSLDPSMIYTKPSGLPLYGDLI